MTLVPPSPQWDAYVAERRMAAGPVWQRWIADGAQLDDIPDDLWVGESPPQEQLLLDVVSPDRLMSPLEGGISVVLDDWAMVAAYRQSPRVADTWRPILDHLRPATVWQDSHVVVLTEQLMDRLWAPPGMDTSRIVSWLELLQLPDIWRSRSALAKLVLVRDALPFFYLDDKTWRHCASNVSLRQKADRGTADAVLRGTEARIASGLFAVGHRADGPGRYVFSGHLRVGAHCSGWDDEPKDIDCHARTTDAFDAGGVVTATVESLLDDYNVVSDSPSDRGTPWLPSDGFQSHDVSRPVPLDVSLPAAARPGSGRHTIDL